MSIIAAGTTTTTALSSTGNTDGTLQFQVNGTTASVTLNTLGAIGVGSSPSFGNSGQVLVSAGSTAAPTWTTNVSSQWTTSGSDIYYNTGNVGVGVVPSAWGSLWKVMQVGNGGAIFGQTNSSSVVHVSGNTYIDSSNVARYMASTSAQRYRGNDGAHEWYTAPVGTAGNAISFTQVMDISAAGVISDQNGKLRAIPKSGASKTSSYTLSPTTDVGEFIEVGSGGSIVVPNATFATGDVVSIFNNTSSNVTMTMNITTSYIAGTDADKNSITLATRGVATVLFISDTVCVVNGNVT